MIESDNEKFETDDQKETEKQENKAEINDDSFEDFIEPEVIVVD